MSICRTGSACTHRFGFFVCELQKVFDFVTRSHALTRMPAVIMSEDWDVVLEEYANRRT